MTAVLLVEDEADIAELITEALQAVGLEVRAAATDEAAYEALEREASRYAALIADINLGVGTTGFDVARRARQLNGRLKVVYITGHAAHMGRFGVEDGVMFPKPLNPYELAQRVQEMVRPADAV
jgi:DNA-binding response OmpR family regulator